MNLRPAAEQDLQEVWAAGARRWGEPDADQYIRSLSAALEAASMRALPGSDRSYVLPGLRKVSILSHHAYCLVDDAGLDVLRILHPRMNVTRGMLLG